MKILFAAVLLFAVSIAKADPTADLFTAATNGDLAAAKKAIADGADINGFEKNGYTPLMIAVWHPDIVQELINAKADLNKASSNGYYTPLTFAATYGITETVEMLVKAGADVNLKNGFGNTPLLVSVGSGKIALVKYFIEKGADTKVINGFNQNMVMMLAGSGKSPVEKVEYYKLLEDITLQAGNKVPEMLIKHQDISLFTPIDEMLDFILSLGFSINDENDVMVPASFPNAQLINDMNKKAKTKQTAVTIAFNTGNADMVGALLSKGAKMGDKNFNASFATALFPEAISITDADLFFVAVRTGNVKLVRQIVENSKPKINKEYKGKLVPKGCNIYNVDGVTVLMLAAAKNDKAMCEYLLSAGARTVPMMKLNPSGGRFGVNPANKNTIGEAADQQMCNSKYLSKTGSHAENFTSDEELKKFLKDSGK